MSFSLSQQPLEPQRYARELESSAAGAAVSFEGRVRRNSHGREVLALEYEAYTPVAQVQGEQILAEATERFGLLGVRCVHRTGRLAEGEAAVWIGVLAAHRTPAFEACQYIIDQLKQRVTIWKREHYADGTAAWLEGCKPQS